MIRAETDCRLVTVRAVVRSANIVPNSNSMSRLSTGACSWTGGRRTRTSIAPTRPRLRDLLDAEVEITGVLSGHFDNKMQQTGILFHVQSLDRM